MLEVCSVLTALSPATHSQVLLWSAHSGAPASTVVPGRGARGEFTVSSAGREADGENILDTHTSHYTRAHTACTYLSSILTSSGY